MTTTPQKPLKKFRIGAIQASVWEQRPEKGQSFLTVTYTRSYKNKEAEWKNGHSFSYEHLDTLVDLTSEVKEYIRAYRKTHTKAA